jgi:hypothetical protein
MENNLKTIFFAFIKGINFVLFFMYKRFVFSVKCSKAIIYHSRKSNCQCAQGNFFYDGNTYLGEYR